MILCIWSGDWVDVDGWMAGWIFERFDWICPGIWPDDQIWNLCRGVVGWVGFEIFLTRLPDHLISGWLAGWILERLAGCARSSGQMTRLKNVAGWTDFRVF